MIQFPQGFLWGAATSAYQVEGDNSNSDWWEWEKRAGLKETSGRACRHYELYKEDFDLARALNHNAHRLSIEWARIEPQEGRFSSKELGHYREVILALRERGLQPIVTLHHFTNPLWFARLGAFAGKKAERYFLRYIEQVVSALCDQVRFWVTINEPMVYVYHAYILGIWPPQGKSLWKAKFVTDNLILSHIKAYRLIHSIYKKRNLPSPFVSIAKNVQAFVACNADSPAQGALPQANLKTLLMRQKNRFAVYLRDRLYNLEFVKKLIRHHTLDFIGINYYSRSLVAAQNWGIRSLLLDVCQGNHSQLKKNSLGWDIYPQGLHHLLLSFKRFHLPLFILENGICTQDDNLRWDYIRAHLQQIKSAMDQGVNLLGYLYWSLLDNYEWDKGFTPRFGLVEVDYHTYKRSVRESARKFSEVCKTGILK
ncbi:MAG: glycoside hydrolase family 1 protein [Candidatus Omnitrophica bacterium]|nr:glycoside hydrolase family 1 protein [Candidatus Omnitrophota bacterium]